MQGKLTLTSKTQTRSCKFERQEIKAEMTTVKDVTRASTSTDKYTSSN